MGRIRVLLGMCGCAALAFGIASLVLHVPAASLLLVGIWLLAALIIHDGLFSPLIIGLGAGLARLPNRGRRYVQAALVIMGSVLVVGAPMVFVRGQQPVSKAILPQDVVGGLGLLACTVVAGALSAYLARVVRDRRRARALADSSDRR